MYYRGRRAPQHALRARLRELAASRVRLGYRRLTVMLRREGWPVTSKRLSRLYRLERLVLCGLALLQRLLTAQRTGGEQRLIPAAIHDRAAVARKLVREVLGVAHTEDLCRRIMAETLGGKGDRGAEGFQMSRWNVNDQPLKLSSSARFELRRQHLNMPIRHKAGLRIELREAFLNEGIEVTA
jgi:hypothetical protein